MDKERLLDLAQWKDSREFEVLSPTRMASYCRGYRQGQADMARLALVLMRELENAGMEVPHISGELPFMAITITFPKCFHRCEIVKHLGVCECASICPEKFDKDGTPILMEVLLGTHNQKNGS